MMTQTMADPALSPAVTGFRSVMAAFPTGVAIVTTAELDGRPRGMTCSSLCSVTLTPPTILVCLNCASLTLAAILRRATFAVNLLHQDAQSTAELFGVRRPDQFDNVRWHLTPGLGGPELLDDAHAAIHCEVAQTKQVGDHAVVFGEVFNMWMRAEPSRPLLYGLRRYAVWPRH
jgi:flavin reductase (NADH)